MAISNNDHGKETEQPRPDDKKARIETVLETAQSLVNAVEQFLLLYAMETDTWFMRRGASVKTSNADMNPRPGAARLRAAPGRSRRS